MTATENPHPGHAKLDEYPLDDLVAALVQDQAGAIEAVSAISGGSTLIATLRPSSISFARYTTAMPPRPSSISTW